MRKLGKTQVSVLRSLREHGGWWAGCGWIWSNRSETIKLLDSLVKRGLATLTYREITTGGGTRQERVYRPVEGTSGEVV